MFENGEKRLFMIENSLGFKVKKQIFTKRILFFKFSVLEKFWFSETQMEKKESFFLRKTVRESIIRWEEGTLTRGRLAMELVLIKYSQKNVALKGQSSKIGKRLLMVKIKKKSHSFKIDDEDLF